MNETATRAEQLETVKKQMAEYRELLVKSGGDGPNPDTMTEVIRGFEIVKWDGYNRTWEVVGHFRNSELALHQAIADCRWLQERHPKSLYQIHALVSHAPPKQAAVIDSTPTEQSSASTEIETAVEANGATDVDAGK